MKRSPKIAHNIPLPKRKVYFDYDRMLEKMNPGDSVGVESVSHALSVVQAGRVRGVQFTMRKQSKGRYRVWMVSKMTVQPMLRRVL